MAYTLISNRSDASPDATTYTTSALNTTGADTLFVAVSSLQGATTPTLTDNKGNSFSTEPPTKQETTSGCRVQLYYCKAAIVGTGHTFTVTGISSSSIAISAWSGGHATAPFDQEHGASNFATTLAPGSITPSQDNEVCIVACTWNAVSNVASIGSGFTITDQQDRSADTSHMAVAMAYKIQTTAAAVNPTWTFSGGATPAADTLISSFKMAGGGGGGGVTLAQLEKGPTRGILRGMPGRIIG